MPGRIHAEALLPHMLPKTSLIAGELYEGKCRNATVARWDGEKFHHWRTKWGSTFVETIKHPDDDTIFDVFVPVLHLKGCSIVIPFRED